MSVTLNVNYKNRLKALMADAGFRRMESLADETGISKNMLYLFERGESNLSIQNVIKILWALDCKFEDLVQYEVESDEPDHIDALSNEARSEIEAAKAEYKARLKPSKVG